MEITCEKQDSIIILGATGRLDTTNYMEFEKKLLDTIAENDKTVIDCTALDYVSSSGLRALLMGMKKAESEGKKLVLCTLQPGIKEIFRISAFINLFKIYNTKEEAIAGIG